MFLLKELDCVQHTPKFFKKKLSKLISFIYIQGTPHNLVKKCIFLSKNRTQRYANIPQREYVRKIYIFRCFETSEYF